MNRSSLFFVLLFFSIAVSFGGQSCSSSSTTPGTKVSPDEDGTFTAEGVEVSIPAGTFGEEMTLALETGEGVVDIGDLKAAYDIFSSPTRLRFSAVQLAQTSAGARIRLTLNDAVGEGASYALVRVAGKQPEFGGDSAEGSNSWRPVFAKREDKKLLLDLFASAEQIDIVAVFPKGQEATKALSRAPSKKVLSAKQQNVGNQGWNDRPWLVYCDRPNLPAGFDCGEQAMVDVARELFRAAQFLKQLGLTNGFLHQTSLREIRAVYGPNVFSDDPDEDALKNFAIVSPALICDQTHLGCYDRLFHTISVTNLAFGDLLGPVIAHELVHAVQRASSPVVAIESPTSRWIWEGSAEAVAVSYDAAILRTHEGGRDWGLSLNSRQDILIPYQTHLFFSFANDGDLTYLAPFFNNVAASPRSYRAAEGGIVGSLANLFDVILTKVYMALFDNGFIDCGEEVNAFDGQTMTVNMERVSEQCVNMKSDDGRCIALTFGDQLGPNNGVFIVNGVGGLPPGQMIETNAEAAQIQIVDINSDEEVAPASPLHITTNLHECEDTLTGVWCDGTGGEIPSHRLFLQQNDDVVTGTAAIDMCEDLDIHIGAGSKNGEDVALVLDGRNGCNESPILRYDLKLANGILAGVFTHRNAVGDEHSDNVMFEKCIVLKVK